MQTGTFNSMSVWVNSTRSVIKREAKRGLSGASEEQHIETSFVHIHLSCPSGAFHCVDVRRGERGGWWARLSSVSYIDCVSISSSLIYCSLRHPELCSAGRNYNFAPAFINCLIILNVLFDLNIKYACTFVRWWLFFPPFASNLHSHQQIRSFLFHVLSVCVRWRQALAEIKGMSAVKRTR